MGRLEALQQRAADIAGRLARTLKENKVPLIISHHDADGLAAASLLAKALTRKQGHFHLRIVSDVTIALLQRLRELEPALIVFTDLGAGFAEQFGRHFEENWLVIDHHELPTPELDQPATFNSWQFGFDGGIEIASGGMSYQVARQLDEANVDLAWLAIVAAIGDRQDRGPGRSLMGLNRQILEDARATEWLTVKTDLVLYGRETRPIHESIAATTTPFLPGLTGNADTCLAVVHGAHIPVREDGRWRTLADLTDEEKSSLVDALLPHLTAAGAGARVGELFGEVYTLLREDEYSPLRDAREFGTLLNACGRMSRAGVGAAICLGDRDAALDEAEQILGEYRQTLSRYIQGLLSDARRIVDHGRLIRFVGDQFVDEQMVGSLASVLGGIAAYSDRCVLVQTQAADGTARFSARRGEHVPGTINLGTTLREAAALAGGTGGGHGVAAGARVPAAKVSEFIAAVAERVSASG
jgi:RecJ-like exonuclease